MANAYFAENGYYINGEGAEISRSCSPLPYIDTYHHLYGILIALLIEIKKTKIDDDIIIYGSSRVIDEMNGVCECLDEIGQASKNYIIRNIKPQIKPVIFFRKKSQEWISERIEKGHKMLELGPEDERKRQAAVQRTIEYLERKKESLKQSRIENFKRRWFDGR